MHGAERAGVEQARLSGAIRNGQNGLGPSQHLAANPLGCTARLDRMHGSRYTGSQQGKRALGGVDSLLGLCSVGEPQSSNCTGMTSVDARRRSCASGGCLKVEATNAEMVHRIGRLPKDHDCT